MTRLGAARKGEFFPTPFSQVPAIVALARALAPAADGTPRGTLLDPCAGDGQVTEALAAAWGLSAYGNELEATRAAEAALRLAACTVGGYESLGNDGARVSALFLNPPYGGATRASGFARRETQAFAACIDHLMPGGLCVCVIPLRVAVSGAFLAPFARACVPVGLARFPEPEFSAFQQVVLWGVRRADGTVPASLEPAAILRELRISWKAATEPTGASIPLLGAWPVPPVALPVADGVPAFRNTGVNPQALADRAAAKGATTLPKFRGLTQGVTTEGDRIQASFSPVLPLKAGHAAELLAAGFLDGAEVQYNGRPCLVRGTVRMKVMEAREDDDERDLVKVTRREVPVTVLTFLDTETGALHHLDGERSREAFEAFVIAQADALIAGVQERYPAHHTPGTAVGHQTNVDAAIAQCRSPQLLEGMADGLLPIQASVVRGVAAAVRAGKRHLFVSGEPGTGKTTIGSAAWAASDLAAMRRGTARALVIAPGHLVKKWKRESERVLSAFGVRAILAKSVRDVDEAFSAAYPTLLVLSQETAKNGMRWTHAGHCTTIRQRTERMENGVPVVERVAVPVVKCPDCGALQYVETDGARNDDDAVRLATWTEDKDGRRVPDFGRARHTCPMCRASLWQELPYATGRTGRRALLSHAASPLTAGLAYGGGKIALATYIARRYNGQYTLLADEAHEYKAGESDRGQAFGRAVMGARVSLALTGTLYGGRASTMFYLAYRMLASFRERFTLSDVDAFIRHYGLSEEIAYEEPRRRGWTSTMGYSRLPAVRRREIPGARPELIALLLPHTVFIDLEDLGVSLPSYDEFKLTAMPPTAAQGALAKLAEFREIAVAAMRQGDRGPLSRWLQCALGWPYAMENDDTLHGADGYGTTLTGVPTPVDGFPLDDQLVRFARAEQAQGRRVLIYVQQVNKRDPSARLVDVLTKAGLRVAELRRTTCKREDREQWVADQVAAGLDNLIVNPALVETGLDLVAFQSVVFWGPCLSTYRGRQAARRTWRLGQTRPVRVLFAAYDGTLGNDMLTLVAKKLRAADRVDGRLIEGLAASVPDDGGDLLDALMRQVVMGRAATGGGFAEYPVTGLAVPLLCGEAA